MDFLILAYFLIFLFLSWKRLDWALMLLIFSLWSYLIRFTVLGIPSTLLEGMILIVFFVWLIKNGKNLLVRIKNRFKKTEQSVNRYPFDWEMIALLILSMLAVATTGWTNEALGLWKAYFLEPVLLFLVVFNVLGKDKQYFKLFYPLAMSALFLSGVAIYQKMTANFIVLDFWTDLEQRATSIFAYPNALGLYLAPLVLVLVGWLAYQISLQSDWQRTVRLWLISLAVIASLAGIVCARSDGALIAVIVALIIFGLSINRKVALITLVLVMVVGVGVFSQANLRQKVVDKVTLFDLSGQIRQQQWQDTWQMLKDGNWLLGAGLSNYQAIVKPYHQDGIFVKNHDPKWLDKVLYDEEYNKQAWQPVEIYLYPHNIFLNFWTELGLLGALLFVWIMVKYLVIGFKNSFAYYNSERYLALGLTGAMITIVVHGLVDVPYFKNDLAVMFWLLVAILGIIHTRNKRSLV